jgi:hypothetical protein
MSARSLFLTACLAAPLACNASPCADIGESLSFTKAEVYTALSPDASAPDGGSPCPTSQEISDYVALRYSGWIAPERIGTPRDDGAACEYPVSDTVCH